MKPVVYESNAVIKILFADNRYWALRPAEPVVLGDVTGMAEPSQTETGKYKNLKKRNTTLNMKKKPQLTKATRDEKRRREEKAKSDYETKIDGMQKCMDSFKADAGELRDKIRNMESRARCQDQYILSLEKQFVNLCDP